MKSETFPGWHSRGYLPHFDAPGLIQHIVFRLADSLPVHVREGITRAPRSQRLEAVDAALDAGHGERYLLRPKIAELVQNALLHFDAERYRLLAWCVMPNHVHALMEAVEAFRVDRIVHSWKSFTGHEANNLLGHVGAFWAPEYFDRYMRGERHLAATLAYIEGNPVKAGVCAEPTDWPYSSASRR